MRAVLQRVERACVRVGEDPVAEMGPGLLALVGVAHQDTASEAALLARKMVHLRVFEDRQGHMNHSLLDTGGTLALVSQFTLLADCRKGRRPSFGPAAAAEQAKPLFEALVEAAQALGVPVVTGRFGATMAVELVNEGPVTVLLDTQGAF